MRYFTLFLTFLIPVILYSQETLTADELFSKARTIAFEEKDYTKSIALAKEALEKSPDYTDISIFLGRLYTWNDDVTSARALFEDLEKQMIADEDFFIAYGSLEFWNDNEQEALRIVEKGLQHHPKSEDLWLLKAKIYSSNDPAKAEEALLYVLELNPKNTEARAMYSRIRELNSKNALSVIYNLTHFDKQFDEDWHIVGLSYKRVTKYGSVILRGNYANKFGADGKQIELEAYPRISKTFYLYVGAGYSEDVGIFPKYRTGISLFANLPKSFEGELGYRQLYFSDNIWMYTASVGKYYKNYWFNVRTYLTPDHKNISHSYTGTVRYYTKGANDYFGIQVGSGISPEESTNNLLANENFKLKTFKAGCEYTFSVQKLNIFTLTFLYSNQEYRINQKGNQFDFSIGYTRNF
ncbi:outer membrane protein, YaiO family [Paenimyroides ummariense]|uniref:Outer membrane protein, YaiO family n=1 Tax=Paenimyroides ummariense TaxID=913024 RepID=A0A1I4Z4T6_9FLAO|nr:YaiO family outer membrane beta-barrel protein [Paenimyroides ummariense]SFN45291.1 outer membrane protein, YaiO family [Paenimyroides ummariense]